MWGMEFYAVIYCIMIVVFALGATAFRIAAQQLDGERAIGEWALGSWLLLVGCLLAVISRSQLSQPQDMWSYEWPALLRSLATVINGYAWLRIWYGFRRYYHQSIANSKISCGVVLAFALVVFSAHPFHFQPAWAVIVISLWVFGCVVVIVWDLCKQSRWLAAEVFTITGFALAGVAWIYRALSLIPDFLQGVEKDVNSSLDSLIMAITLIAMISIYLGMTLLIYQRLVDKLRAQASTDVLTGAFNRRAFLERSELLLAAAKRERKPVSVVLFDLDFFKKINDDFGHQAGDEILKATVDVCHNSLREQDVFGRYGGEEFVAFLPDTTESQAQSALARLQQELASQSVEVDGQRVGVTVSIGLACVVPEEQALEALVKNADLALYRAKQTGRNKVVVWEGEGQVAVSAIS